MDDEGGVYDYWYYDDPDTGETDWTAWLNDISTSDFSYDNSDTSFVDDIDWDAWLADATAVSSNFVDEIPNNTNPGEVGYGWRYFSDGTAISPDGVYYQQGQEIYNPNTGTFSGVLDKLVKAGGDTVKRLLFKNGTDASGGLNLAGLATAAAGAYALFGGNEVNTGGWQKPVPKMDAVREAVPYDDTNRRPGAGGRQYFTDTTYVPQGDADALAAAQTKAQDQITALKTNAPTYSTPAPVESKIPMIWNTPSSFQNAPVASEDAATAERGTMAEIDPQTGGLVGLARGGAVPQFRGDLQSNGFVLPGDVVAHADPRGQANKERGLRALHKKIGVEAIRGPGDAMSDSIPTTIDGREPARVANGEAYVPKENVARMGGGDMDEGAARLREIMNGLRKQRTGSTEQINPDNPNELRAAYGGQVKRFGTGDAVTPTSYGNTASGNLSEWVGDYATTALGEGAAAADMPYQAYQGPLTAGASNLQTQAFAGAQNLAETGYTPTQYSGGIFDTAAAQQYMNPYLQTSLDPQLQEMKRQADIERIQNAGRMTRAGSFGGSRQALMETEGQRNLLDKQRQALAEGYNTAYDKAMAQYNADQNRRMDADKNTEASRQYAAEFGRQSIKDLAELGATQREIEQAGIDADKAQFEEERDWAYQMPKYKLGLLSGLPVSSTATTPNTTDLSQIQTQLGELGTLYTKIDDALRALGQS